MMTRWMRVVPLAALLAACAGDADDAPPPPAGEPVTSAAPDSTAPAAAPGSASDSAPGLAVVVNRRGERSYALWGRTDARALELSVEDGHNVLYGPAQVEVRGGAFSADLILEPTDRPTVFAYVTEPDGARQWVIPIPLDAARVAWGAGAAELPETAPAN